MRMGVWMGMGMGMWMGEGWWMIVLIVL